VLDNSWHPFEVEVSRARVTVFLILYDDDDDAPKRLGREPLLVLSAPRRVFLGRPLNANLLVHEAAGTYVLIGGEVVRFRAPGEITDFACPVGNNGVPYPVARDAERTYLLLRRTWMPNALARTRDGEGPYEDFWGMFRARTAHTPTARRYEREWIAAHPLPSETLFTSRAPHNETPAQLREALRQRRRVSMERMRARARERAVSGGFTPARRRRYGAARPPTCV
jgi:hypothetical protein